MHECKSESYIICLMFGTKHEINYILYEICYVGNDTVVVISFPSIDSTDIQHAYHGYVRPSTTLFACCHDMAKT